MTSIKNECPICGSGHFQELLTGGLCINPACIRFCNSHLEAVMEHHLSQAKMERFGEDDGTGWDDEDFDTPVLPDPTWDDDTPVLNYGIGLLAPDLDD